MGSMMSTIGQGMAFGTGSAIAHRAVGAVAGSMSGGGDAEQPANYEGQPQQQQQQQQQQQFGDGQQMQMGGADACGLDKQNFFECLKMNNGDGASCQFLYDAMKSCQTNGASQQQWA
ncbi:hypothetical protein TeGR_g7650 [Tetraparma gracilis]|nr:hypothetical protein TeGR_g7650 [Tetraparma gracilis]